MSALDKKLNESYREFSSRVAVFVKTTIKELAVVYDMTPHELMLCIAGGEMHPDFNAAHLPVQVPTELRVNGEVVQ